MNLILSLLLAYLQIIAEDVSLFFDGKFSVDVLEDEGDGGKTD